MAIATHKYWTRELSRFVSSFQLRAEKKEVKSKLTKLHAAMNQYMKANGSVWPQPKNGSSDEEVMETFIAALEPYGVSVDDWAFREQKYAIKPTRFDGRTKIAYRYDQAWFICREKIGGMYYIVDQNGTVGTAPQSFSPR